MLITFQLLGPVMELAPDKTECQLKQSFSTTKKHQPGEFFILKDIEEDDCSSIVDQVDENEGEYKAHFSIKEPNLYLQQNPMKDNCRTQIAFCPHNFPSGEVSKDLVHQKICPSRLFMIVQ